MVRGKRDLSECETENEMRFLGVRQAVGEGRGKGARGYGSRGYSSGTHKLCPVLVQRRPKK